MTRQDEYPAGAPCWVDTWQHDPRAARAFYGPPFGWSFDPPVAGVTVPPHGSVNFAVGDVDAECERAVGLGGSLLMPPFDTPGFRNAVIADPQDAVIALSS